MSEEEKSFVVRDRRGRGEEKGEGASQPPPSAAEAKTGSNQGGASARQDEGTVPVTFSSFVFSLSTSAMMLMGEQLDPQQGRVQVNLPQAKEIIDILSMLEGKTRGNLTSEEEAVLTDMLYALRMKYVDVASGKPAGR
ncbi:DUF1844 domain-containing protein [Candidatus Nitrospira bockiana]